MPMNIIMYIGTYLEAKLMVVLLEVLRISIPFVVIRINKTNSAR